MIYYTGGGLGGKALSLKHDLLVAVPVFFGIGLGIYLLHFKFEITKSEVFLIASLIGLIVEFNAGLMLAIPGMYFYGSMMAAGSWIVSDSEGDTSKNLHSSSKTLVIVVLGLIITAIFMLLGAIVGDNLYKMLGP